APVVVDHLCASGNFLIAQCRTDLYLNPLAQDSSKEGMAWQKIGTGQFISAFTWPSPEENYVFAYVTQTDGSRGTFYWVITDEGAENYKVAQYQLPGLYQIAYSASCFPLVGSGVEQFACSLVGEEPGWFRVTFNQNTSDKSLTLGTQDRIVPYISQT